ncbi:hypothetical protein COLO4_03286 [Corchorus olitorius]|uniref:Uncharacterized protein n=1 Tax=Corchorus olitorius TaxID=93759 RepID=A0A1R3KZ90_9ROSI|nr:hypothetical protein COLO4_03286 [Corchorus olitorius]
MEYLSMGFPRSGSPCKSPRRPGRVRSINRPGDRVSEFIEWPRLNVLLS